MTLRSRQLQLIQRLRATQTSTTSGLTMLEIIVVLIIFGVLTAIAAPSWQQFANNQRTSNAGNRVLDALRAQQQEAKRTRRAREVLVNPDNDDPPRLIYRDFVSKDNEVSVQLGDGTIEDGWVTLTAVDDTGRKVDAIVFESDGSLDVDVIDDNNYTLPIHITASSQESNSKRCVQIRTLLSAMELMRDEDCK